LISNLSISQGLRNEGGNVIIQNTANIIISGNGHWTNNGTADCIAGSWVRMAGNTTQMVQGSSTTAFSNLEANNSSTGLQLGTSISVFTSLLMSQGDFDLKDYNIDLSTTGSIGSETSAKRIKATNAVGADGGGTGTIFATRLNPSGNVANLGLNITPSAALGNTIIARGHQVQAGSGSFAGNSSIFRYYDIRPTTYSNTDFTFSYFPAWELNGHVDGSLIAFQSVQYSWGGTPGPVYWQPLITVNGTPIASATTVNNILTANVRVTLGSFLLPLPVEMVSFSGKCKNGIIELNWETSSEINNDYFEVQKSLNGTDFYSIGIIEGAGNSTTTLSYLFEDNTFTENSSFYRIKQTDFDGYSYYSEIISIECFSTNFNSFNAFFNNENIIILQFSNFQNTSFEVKLFDQLGKLIETKNINIYDDYHEVSLNKLHFPGGIYYIYAIGNNSVMTRKIFIP